MPDVASQLLLQSWAAINNMELLGKPDHSFVIPGSLDKILKGEIYIIVNACKFVHLDGI